MDLDQIKQHTLLLLEHKPKPPGDQFCGLAFHGRTTPFTLKEHQASFHAFRCLSRYSYPVYLFINPKALGEAPKLIDLYGNILLIPIDPMSSTRDYDRFVLFEMFDLIRYERTLTFHSDGFLLSPGWEDFVLKHDFDYIGAPWPALCGSDDRIILPEARHKYPEIKPAKVGNGGFCFRKRSKCLEVAKKIDRLDLNWDHSERGLPDDVVFSYFGFGLGVFKRFPIELAYVWASEPFRGFHTFGFHSTEQEMIQRQKAKPCPSSSSA